MAMLNNQRVSQIPDQFEVGFCNQCHKPAHMYGTSGWKGQIVSQLGNITGEN